MDATETHYVDYDPEKVWDEMMRVYIQNGGDILWPGDEKEIFLRAVLAIATAIMAKIDNALRMDTLKYATGDYLKLYGQKRNCEYIEARAATARVEITFQATGTAKTIPAGAELTADGTMVYTLTESVAQTGSVQTIQTTVECATAGSVGNGLHAGANLHFVESQEAVTSVIVLEDAGGGMDAEDEEVYRERIHTYGLSTITTGTQQAYESAAKAVSSQIIDARALNDGAGQVGIYLILEDGASESAIKGSVAQALTPVSRRPLDDEVHVYTAAEVAYTLSVQIWKNSYTAMTEEIEIAIEEYHQWQDNTVGQPFNPDKLIMYLLLLGADRVEFAEGSGISGSVEYRNIPDRSRCKGTITWEVMQT